MTSIERNDAPASRPPSRRTLALVGAGELARIVLSLLRDVEGLECVACAVGAEHRGTTEVQGVPVITLEELATSFPPADHELLVCVGYRRVNRGREELTSAVLAKGYRLATFVHPTAWVSPDASLSPGDILFPRVVVEPYASLGTGCILWSGSVVAHDTRVGAFCFLAPNATIAGNVRLGDRSFVGANATIRDGVTIGSDCVIGAGALLKHDATPGTVFPAIATREGERRSSTYTRL